MARSEAALVGLAHQVGLTPGEYAALVDPELPRPWLRRGVQVPLRHVLDGPQVATIVGYDVTDTKAHIPGRLVVYYVDGNRYRWHFMPLAEFHERADASGEMPAYRKPGGLLAFRDVVRLREYSPGLQREHAAIMADLTRRLGPPGRVDHQPKE